MISVYQNGKNGKSYIFSTQTNLSLEITLALSVRDFMSKLPFSLTISLKKYREEKMERKLDFDNVKN